MADLFPDETGPLQHLRAALPPKLHPTLVVIAEELFLCLAEDADAVAALGPDRLADIVLEQIDRMAARAGGCWFYLPKGLERRLSERDCQIVAEFNGRNKAELARKYRLSEMRIDQIVAAYRLAEFNARQGKLKISD